MTQDKPNQFAEMKTIFVSNLDKKTTENELFSLINNELKIQISSVYIRKDEHFDTAIAYINMGDHDAAKAVISKFNGYQIKSYQVRMSWALSNPSKLHQHDANIFVKGIKKEVSQHQLQEVFERYGEILSCKLSTNEKGESNGFGYVNYNEVEGSTKAINALEELRALIGAEGFSVTKYDKPQKTDKTNLYVGNIQDTITEEDFIKYFETFGPIRENNGRKTVAFYSVAGTGKKKGYVNFENAADAEKAIASPKVNVLGEGELVIAYYKTKTERKREHKAKADEIKRVIRTDFKDFNLYINTNKDVITLEEINEAMKECGEIYSVKIHYTKEKRPDGIFYICMKNKEDKEKVMKRCEEIGWQHHNFKPRDNQPRGFNPYMMMPNMQMPMNNNNPMNYAHNPFMMTIWNMLQNFSQGGYPMANQYQMQQQFRKQPQRPSSGSKKKPRIDNKMKDRIPEKQVEKKPEPQPVPQVVTTDKEVVTDEMKNDLGDHLYDYIIEVHKYDDEMTGRITGVLLESLEYHDLNAKLQHNRADLNAIIEEIKVNLDNM